MIDSIIELTLQVVEGITETADWALDAKSKVKKVQKQLTPFQGNRVEIKSGEVLKGGKFRMDETTIVATFKSEANDEKLAIWLDSEQCLEIHGKTISRFYTGKKSETRICINTNGIDYLIDLVKETV